MVRIIPSKKFIKDVKKLDAKEKEKLAKLIKKVIEDPFVGKPLKYRRGERALKQKPYRLIYAIKNIDIVLLKFEHRNNVYKH